MNVDNNTLLLLWGIGLLVSSAVHVVFPPSHSAIAEAPLPRCYVCDIAGKPLMSSVVPLALCCCQDCTQDIEREVRDAIQPYARLEGIR